MTDKSYHHGNLSNELIEVGIKMINEEGIGNFTLRKVAKRVGVSAAACYNHFTDKEQLLMCMKDYVNNKLAQVLQEAAKCKEDELPTLKMGVAYVCFFAENPHYFTFIYDNKDYWIELTPDDFRGDYKPFCIFKEVAIRTMEKVGIPKEEHRNNLLAMWAMVQGLSSMANMKGFHYEGDWGKLTKKILEDKVKFM